MIGDQLEFRPYFNCGTCKFKIVDETDWPVLADEGVYPVEMTITGLGPTGVSFPSSPVTINYLASNYLEESGWFQLPKQAGAIMPGAYAFTASMEIDYNIVDYPVDSLAFNTIVLTGDFGFLEAGDDVTLAGSTNPGNDGTWPVVAAIYNEDSDTTNIVVVAIFAPEVPSTARFSFVGTKTIEKTQTYTYTECEEVTVSIGADVDCAAANGAGSLTVTDTTTIPNGQQVLNGTGTNTTKRISVTYPVGLVPAPAADPKTTYNSVMGISPIADTVGDQYPFVAVVVLDMKITQDDGLIVLYTARGQKSISVVCSNSLCNFTECINEAVASFATQANRGVLPPANLNDVVLINSYQRQYELAKSCGNYTDMQAAITNLSNLLGKDCGCSDASTDTGPSWLNDSGGLLYSPDWTFQSYVPIYRNPTEFDGNDTEYTEAASAIVVGRSLMANVGDQVNIYIEGYMLGGSGDVTVINTTTGVTYLNTGSLPSGVSFQFRIQITRVDGDLTSWVMTRRTETAGVVAYTSSDNPLTSDYDLETDNIIDAAPTDINTQITVLKLWVERETILPE